jgi:hypothetical protein
MDKDRMYGEIASLKETWVEGNKEGKGKERWKGETKWTNKNVEEPLTAEVRR